MELGISSFAELTHDMVTGKTISGHQRMKDLMEEIELTEKRIPGKENTGPRFKIWAFIQGRFRKNYQSGLHLEVHRNQLSVQPAWDFHWPWILSEVIRIILSFLWIYTVKQL
jgi:hypothetical protein